MNKKRYGFILVAFGLVFISSALFAKANTTPIGYWKQYSDKTQQLESVIKVWQKGDVLYGKVAKAYSDGEGHPPQKYCTRCKGKFYNKKIVGMTILWGFQSKSATQWDNGKILDPHSGKIYSCKLTLSDDGQQLKVRGYIGFSLLGRTQVWHRTMAVRI
jgi:uncharacterized protein (DUF2147 family)